MILGKTDSYRSTPVQQAGTINADGELVDAAPPSRSRSLPPTPGKSRCHSLRGSPSGDGVCTQPPPASLCTRSWPAKRSRKATRTRHRSLGTLPFIDAFVVLVAWMLRPEQRASQEARDEHRACAYSGAGHVQFCPCSGVACSICESESETTRKLWLCCPSEEAQGKLKLSVARFAVFVVMVVRWSPPRMHVGRKQRRFDVKPWEL
jgi:hypothetical protein